MSCFKLSAHGLYRKLRNKWIQDRGKPSGRENYLDVHPLGDKIINCVSRNEMENASEIAKIFITNLLLLTQWTYDFSTRSGNAAV